MKHFKKILGVFVFVMVGAILLPNNVFASTTLENVDEVMKKISPDLENATFYMKKPTTMEEADFSISGYINKLISGEDYNVFGFYDIETDNCEVSFQSSDYQPGEYIGWNSETNQPIYSDSVGWTKSYNIKVDFVTPSSNATVSDYISKLNDLNPTDSSTYYIIEDLSLINYYLTSEKSELWNPGAPGRALKYSTINNVTKGANITYYLEIRAGSQDETLMYESAFGPMSIFYNGSLYGTKEEGVYLKRVIYIPQATADTKEAYIEAAQKRINDYLENNSVVVSYGGLISSLDDGSEDPDYPISSDGNYYNVKIESRTYKFYIVKGTDSQLIEPTYLGLDLESKIEITSEDSTIPLDTALTVKNVDDTSIKNKIETENYYSFDISLYSDAKSSKIEKLNNGKFLVKIPVPTELSGKDLIVYYLTSNGDLEEHAVTIKDSYAEFETDHFSVYTLAEKTTSTTPTTPTSNTTTDSTNPTSNPQTGDNIMFYISMLGLSIIGLVGAGLYTRKRLLNK